MRIETKHFGLFVCFVWLSYIFMVIPPSMQSVEQNAKFEQSNVEKNVQHPSADGSDQSINNLYKGIWTSTVVSLVFIAFGTILGWTFFSKEKNKVLISVLSLCFLVYWLIKITAFHFSGYLTPFGTYYSRWFTAITFSETSFSTKLNLVYNDILLPIFHFLIILFMSRIWVLTKIKNNKDGF